MSLINLNIDESRLKDIRKTLSLTQAGLAEKINVKVSTIKSWEQGKRNIPESIALLLHYITKEYLKI